MIVGFLAAVSTHALGAEHLEKLAHHVLRGAERREWQSAITDSRRRDFVAGRSAAKIAASAARAYQGLPRRGWRALGSVATSPGSVRRTPRCATISHTKGLAFAFAPIARRAAGIDIERRAQHVPWVPEIFNVCEPEPRVEQWMLKEVCAKIAGLPLVDMATTVVTVRIGRRLFVAFRSAAGPVRPTELFVTTSGLPVCLGLGHARQQRLNAVRAHNTLREALC